MTYPATPDLPRPLAPPFELSPLLMGLLNALNDDSLSYCYWKNCRRLDHALAGHSDLDLLVGRSDRERALKLLTNHGFKHWPDMPGRDHPAIMSFLGYDEVNGVIHHVHVHFRLVIGHAMLKNYRVPCENRFLARSIRHSTFPVQVLDLEDEALLLLIRMHVELSWLDPVAWRQRRAIRRKITEDFTHLVPGMRRDILLGRATELFSAEVARAIVDDFPTIESPQAQRRIRSAIIRELAAFQLYSGTEAMVRTFGRTIRFIATEIDRRLLHWPRPSRRRTPGGGIVISFIGLDGSGKSTQLAMTRTWLEREIDVLTYYFGTGDGHASFILSPFKAFVPLATQFIKTKPKGASHGKISDKPPGFFYSICFVVWSSAVALDKRHKIMCARRAASRGMVVLTDRYPQNQIAGFNDGPLLPRITHAPAWLRRFEASVYALAHRTSPDLVIKLHTTPETVEEREPDMNPLLIRQRIAWLKDLKFPGGQVVSVDARRPLEEVTRSIKHEIWKIL